VVVSGSAVSAPLLPLVVLLLGAWLARRSGKARVVGLVLLLLACVVMTIGWVGEYTSGVSFTGGHYAVFVALSVLGMLLTIALAVAAARGLMRRTA
jgi:hypothetical protein